MEGVFSLTQRDVLTCKVSYNLFFFFTFFTCFHYSIHIKSKDAYSNDWIDKVILQIRFIPKFISEFRDQWDEWWNLLETQPWFLALAWCDLAVPSAASPLQSSPQLYNFHSVFSLTLCVLNIFNVTMTFSRYNKWKLNSFVTNSSCIPKLSL